MDAFAPDLIVVACGQDASQFDPNGRMCVTWTASASSAPPPALWPIGTATAGWCSCRRAATGARYSGLCMHATIEGVLGTGPLLDDPMAYLPDDLDRARCRHRGAPRRARSVLAALVRHLLFAFTGV